MSSYLPSSRVILTSVIVIGSTEKVRNETLSHYYESNGKNYAPGVGTVLAEEYKSAEGVVGVTSLGTS